MPRERHSLAASIASIERGRLSGSEWTWISITPFRVCAVSADAATRRLMHQVIDLLLQSHIILRLAIVRHEAVDLLLDIGQLGITIAGEGRDLRDGLVETSQTNQRGGLGLFEAG